MTVVVIMIIMYSQFACSSPDHCLPTHVLADAGHRVHNSAEHREYFQFRLHSLVFLLPVARPGALPATQEEAPQAVENLHWLQLLHPPGQSLFTGWCAHMTPCSWAISLMWCHQGGGRRRG